jgi:peroxiredoxin Q/BCP
VLGCSPDGPDAHQAFIAKYDLGVGLLCDPQKQTMAAYDAFGEKSMYGKTVQGVKRSTVLIDPEGRIAHHFVNVRAKGHAAKVAERLEQLRSA